jgi:hemoglobin-like flavoprotein
MVAAKYEEEPMQDLFQNYVDDLRKLRDAFHQELGNQARELSKAMSIYARNNEAALSMFMEKVAARGAELETAAAARLDQFRGLRALTQTPADADQERVAAAAERALGDGLDVEVDRDRKTGRPMVLVKSNPAA